MKKGITGQARTRIDVPASRVWQALTQPEIIKQYFFGTTTKTDWKAGSPITFTGAWDGKTYEDKGTILKFEPNKQLAYSYWSSMSGIEDKPENYVTVTYTLEEDGPAATQLTITQENIPDEKMKAHSENNWNMVLRGMKDLLEQKEMTI